MLKISQKQLSNKKSTRSSLQWTQNNFKQFYPQSPAFFEALSYLNIKLNYKNVVIKAKVPFGISNAYLPYIFHQQIYRYLLLTNSNNPLRLTAEIVGFQSINKDLLLDYKISIGKGTLHSPKTFNCLEYIETGKLKKYKIYKCLAIGGFSKVYLVRSLRDGKFYAMKVMSKRFVSENQKRNFIRNERDICCQLNHPFIIKLNQCFQTHNFVCLVLDYCPGGQLFYYLKQIKRMREEDARFYFIQILYGLMYIHQNKIIYRDLKPENLLIDYDGHIKITDFGLSKANMEPRQATYSFCGSTQYMPPEMIKRNGHSFGIDYYTLGALLYELVTGLPPFYSRDQQQIKSSIVYQELTFPDNIQLSAEIKSLLSNLLNKDPRLRIGSLKGIKQILFHPWIGRINSENVLNKKLEPPYIPSFDQFNFDENQLGSDEKQFTNKLKDQYRISPNRQKLIFDNIDFINQKELNPNIKKILEKYPAIQKISTRTILRQSQSMKSLKSITPNKTPRRQFSSSCFNTKEDNMLNKLHQRNSLFCLKQKYINAKFNNEISLKKICKTQHIPKISFVNQRVLKQKSIKKDIVSCNPFTKRKEIKHEISNC